MSEPRVVLDPLDTAGAAYVPRPDCGRAIGELERALRAGATVATLSGPVGIGRSTLLRVLESKLSEAFRCVYIPFAGLQADEIYTWILGLLDEPAEGDAEAALLDAAQGIAASERCLVVLIDDAEAMPVVSARRLAALLGAAQGSIRLVAVLSGDVRAEGVREALGGPPADVRLDVRSRSSRTNSHDQ